MMMPATAVFAMAAPPEGGSALVRLRLWALFTLVGQGSAFLGRDVLDQLFYALRPEVLDAVIKRLRDFFQTGATHLKSCDLHSLVAAELRAPVRFLGRVSNADLQRLYACADVYTMLCRNRWGGLEQEGFGIVFVEAAACGVPQVAGDSGGAAEAVADGETAKALDAAGLCCNYNTVPFDPRKPFDPSGIRLGTPAVTSRGMKAPEMAQIAAWIDQVAAAPGDAAVLERVRGEVRELTARFPAPGLAT